MRPMVAPEDAAYHRAVASQIRQYPDARDMHALPAIFHYWGAAHLIKKAAETIGSADPQEFIATNIAEAVARTGLRTVLSIGAGDAMQEIAIAHKLDQLGGRDVHIACLDLSDTLVRQGADNIARAGLTDRLSIQQCDVNRQFPPGQVAAVIAIDALHHVLDLETLFAHIWEAIGENGLFVTRDMIGRNGHMRWPEILEPMRELWRTLPLRVRYHYARKEADLWFENFDCSTEGFEAIRSQDILPLLTRNFAFEKYLAYGGVVDVFLDRLYGHNLDPDRDDDRAFIDSLQAVEDRLIAAGHTKPTSLYAVMHRQRANDDATVQEAVRRLIRWPSDCPPQADFRAAGLVVPYPAEAPPPLAPALAPGRSLRFAVGHEGLSALRWGWWAPETAHVWTYRDDSAIGIRFVRGSRRHVVLMVSTVGYVVASLGPQIVRASVNGNDVGTIIHRTPNEHVVTQFVLGDDLVPEDESEVVIRFATSYSRRPDRDGGEDQRAVGFALLAVADVTDQPAPVILHPRTAFLELLLRTRRNIRGIGRITKRQ